MKDRDYLAELLFGLSNPFAPSSSFGFTSDSTYGPYGVKHNTYDSEYDIELTKDGAYISFEVPGFTKDNLEISIEDRVIIIKGERIINKKGDVKNILHKYKVDSNFNESNIEATVSNGILTLFLPNYIAKPKKTITIN
jgi:HSP20 family molecular chaperone IbpA